MESENYSVLMSLYTKENPSYLKISIDSMLKQSLTPNEIVIVKDGPLTKELDEIIDFYKLKEPKIFTIVSLEKNVGLGKALNEGLKSCRNELVARMDTDDISLEKRCEIQIDAFLKDEKLELLGSNVDEFYEDSREIISSRIVPSTHEKILKFARRRNPFNHPTVMYKKTSVLGSGGYGDFRRNQDLDLFVRMLNNGSKAKNINESLLLFRANKDSFKRRKSWEKCKSYIYIIYVFWKKGYSNLADLVIVTVSQVVVFLLPEFVFKIIVEKYLRKIV